MNEHEPRLDLSPLPEPPPKPRLRGTVVLRETLDSVLDALAADLLVHATNCRRTMGDFHLAVSARPETEPFFRRMMYDPLCREFPWSRTHLWLVDECVVEPDHRLCRFATVQELLVEHSGIPREQVHPIRVESPSAAGDYGTELRAALGWREKGHDRLDFVLLALGPGGEVGGHRHAALGERGTLVEVVPAADDGQPECVALSLGTINAARFVSVLAHGSGRAKAVVALGGPGRGAYPVAASALAPVGGELRWYLDHAALGAPVNL